MKQINKNSRRNFLGVVATGALAATASSEIVAMPGKVQPDSTGITHAMWTHGHSLQVQNPELAKVTKLGYSVQIDQKPGSHNWIHFAIPTPVIINDTRAQAGSILLVFKTGSKDAWIDAVHVYDGDKRIATYDNLHLSPKDNKLERFSIPGNPQITWGLGISVGISTGVESMSHTFGFISAGCDFV